MVVVLAVKNVVGVVVGDVVLEVVAVVGANIFVVKVVPAAVAVVNDVLLL